MVTVTGGKWTTYRLMAEHAIDAAIKAADKGREEVGDDNVTTSSAAEDTSKEETTLAAKASPCRTNSVGVVGAHGYTLDLPARLIQLSSRRSASHSGDGGGGGRGRERVLRVSDQLIRRGREGDDGEGECGGEWGGKRGGVSLSHCALATATIFFFLNSFLFFPPSALSLSLSGFERSSSVLHLT